MQSNLRALTPGSNFWYKPAAAASNEAGVLVQTLARFYGTNNCQQLQLLLPPG